MSERFGLQAARAIGVAVAGLMLIVGGAFAADQLANAGRDDGIATPSPVLAPAILDVSGSDDSDDEATESPEATDDSGDEATESPEATDDSGDEATESPEATDDHDDSSPEPSDDAGHG
jgi:hypothetical protein